MLYKVRNSDTEFFDEYSSMVSEAKLKKIKGTGHLNKCFKDYQ